MRSKNSKPHDALESAWLADVKLCACVFCNAPAPVEAHHVKQGRHFCTVSACKPCHDSKAWKIGHPNEFDAVNETIRRVETLRNSGTAIHPRRNLISVPAPKKSSTSRPSKIIDRR